MKKYSILVLFFFLCIQLNAQHGEFTFKPGEARQKLIEGNQRFLSSAPIEKDFNFELKDAANGQHPYATILTCSDSRVPPEIIFDESIGKLFIIRVAGNIIDPVTLGSIEYAVEHLGCSYVLVLGHNHCGAVKATISGGDFSPSITEIAKLITPAVKKAEESNPRKEDFVDMAIKENVLLQIKYASEMSESLAHLIKEGKIEIGGAIYNISTGEIDFIEK
jgi:carbonic anhydrase